MLGNYRLRPLSVVRPENRNAGGGPASPRCLRQGSVSRCWETHLPSCREEAAASERDLVKVGVARGGRRSVRAGSCGAVAAARRGFAMGPSSAVVLCAMQGDGEVRAWLLGVHSAVHPKSFLASLLPRPLLPQQPVLSWDVFTLSSPHQREESSIPVAFSIAMTPAMCAGYPPWCQPIAWCGLQEPWWLTWVTRAKRNPRDQARLPCPRGKRRAESQLCDLPACSLFVTAWERKEAIRKVLFALQR